MSGRYLLAIDNGGTETKAAIFDRDGHEVAVASRHVPIDFPEPGFTERDASLVWEANVHAIQEALATAGIEGADIAGIGLTGYGNGICLVDEQGDAVAPLIISTDERAGALRNELRASGAEREIYPMTCQTLWAAQPACLLPWFKRHRPDILNRARWCFGIKDFIRMKLTGNACYELTEASSGCLMNLHTRAYDDRIFETLGIADLKGIMPPIVESTAVSGTVTEEAAARCGLAAGIPVAGGYFDIDAAALASGVRDCQTLSLVAGTWSINDHLATEANTDYDKNANTTTLSYWPGHFLVEESWATSASNFNWFVTNLLEPDLPKTTSRSAIYRRRDELMASTDPASGDVVFVPYLFDSSTTEGARGTFLNLTGSTTRDDMMLAVCEGVCFSTRLNVGRLVRPGHTFTHARLSGGVSKSEPWTQMMADILDIPMTTLESSELTAQGAAMAAGVACGMFDSLDAAIDAMVHTRKTYEPDPARRSVYDRKWQTYLRALDALETFHGQGDPA